MKAQLTRGTLTVSVIISLLVLLASCLGLFYPGSYQLETENWRMQAQGQDIGNLVAVAMLLFSAYGMKKGSFKASLVWVGTLFYLLYAYIIYTVAVHFGSLFLLYTAILGLVVYTLIFWFFTHPIGNDTAHYPSKRIVKFSAYVLIVTGALFTLLWLSEIIPALMVGEAPKSLIEAGLISNPVHVIDLSTVLPAMILTGVAALKARRSGLYFVAPLLAFTAVMGISVVVATIIITASGAANAVAPMVIVSVLVLFSSIALYYFLKNVTPNKA